MNIITKEDGKVIRRKKLHAVVDIEMILMISLSIAALFLIFNLFSSNLSKITSKNQLSDLSSENTSRTGWEKKWDKDPTQTQVNVQMVGDHGLQWYHEQAQLTIEDLGARPAGSLSNPEWANLAKSLTVFGESVPNGGSQLDVMNNTCLGAISCYGSSNSYFNVGKNHGILIDWAPGTTTISRPNNSYSSKTTPWVQHLTYQLARPLSSNQAIEEQRVKNIQDIQVTTFILP